MPANFPSNPFNQIYTFNGGQWRYNSAISTNSTITESGGYTYHMFTTSGTFRKT